MGVENIQILLLLERYPVGLQFTKIENNIFNNQNKCPGVLRTLLSDAVRNGHIEMIDNAKIVYRITPDGVKYIRLQKV